MYTRKDIKKLENLAKIHHIEIIALCTQCGERWATIEEWEIIKKCYKCKTGNFIIHYANLDDTFEAIEELEKECLESAKTKIEYIEENNRLNKLLKAQKSTKPSKRKGA